MTYHSFYTLKFCSVQCPICIFLWVFSWYIGALGFYGCMLHLLSLYSFYFTELCTSFKVVVLYQVECVYWWVITNKLFILFSLICYVSVGDIFFIISMKNLKLYASLICSDHFSLYFFIKFMFSLHNNNLTWVFYLSFL